MEEPSEPRRDRSAPLVVRRDPNKAKKHPFSRPPQQRPPVIIYTDSPTVVHTSPGEFMSTVQRLTGAPSSSSNERAFDVGDHRGGATSVGAVALAPLPESLVEMSPDCFSPPVAAAAADDWGNAQHSFSHQQFSGGCSSSHADDAFFAGPANNLLATPPGPVVSSSSFSPAADYWDPFDHDQDQV